MKNIIFFGTGAVAAEITSYLEEESWRNQLGAEIKGYVASVDNAENTWRHYQLKKPYLGDYRDYAIEDNDYFILALSNGAVKASIVEDIRKRGGKFITIIHPTAIVSPSAVIGEGNILYPYTMVGPKVELGNFNLLTSQSIISHDCTIGDYNFFATALLCGYNKVGDRNFFGIRSTTIPKIMIGDDNLIQAGMIADKNVGDGTTVFFRFKEKVMAIPQN